VMTQWPRTPAQSEQEFIQNFRASYPAGAGNPSPDENSPFRVANLTMETTSSFQTGQSCMKCHFNAGRTRGTEFVWTVPLRAFRASQEDAERIKAEMLRELRGG